MGIVDVIIYILLLVFLVWAIWMQASHYVCDSLQCAFVKWAEDRSTNDRDKFINIVELQTRRSVWMLCYIVAFILTALMYWWFTGGLPPVIYFLALLAMVFIVIYFSLTFYQHHHLGPVNADLRDYMAVACSKDDPRRTTGSELGQDISATEDALKFACEISTTM